VLLIETAGDALAILPEEEVKDENPDQFVRERALAFRQLASRYFSLVNVKQLFNSIQIRLTTLCFRIYNLP
jgi:hypothetical protein